MTFQTLLHSIYELLKSKYNSFLSNQKYPSPLLYFIFFAYSHMDYQSQASESYGLYAISTVLLLTINFNFLFMLSPLVQNHFGYITYPMFLLCAFCANQKWKLYLLLYTIGNSLTKYSQTVQSNYLVWVSFYLCLETYFRMPFRSLRENQQYFSGFFAILSVEFMKLVLFSTNNFESELELQLFVLIPAFGVAYVIYSHRIEALLRQNPSTIRNNYVLRQYLVGIQAKTIHEIQFKLIKVKHERECCQIKCFCREFAYGQRQIDLEEENTLFLKNLYKNLLSKREEVSDAYILKEAYIQFLLQSNDIPNAIYQLNTSKNTFNYFKFISNTRCKTSVSNNIAALNSNNQYTHQQKYALEYDNLSQQLTMQMSQILDQKMQFWKEASTDYPYLSFLQSKGLLIVNKMQRLDQLYHQEIKKREDLIFSFRSTILYAMYLLSTTNFQQYAESLIKDTSRLLESIDLHENNVGELMTIQAVVVNKKKIYLQKHHPIKPSSSRRSNIKLKNSKEQEQQNDQASNASSSISESMDTSLDQKQQKENPFQIIITEVSSTLSKLLGFARRDLLTKDISQLCPKPYQPFHFQKIAQMLSFSSYHRWGHSSLNFTHELNKVPILGNQFIINANLTIKLLLSHQNQAMFLICFKKADEGTQIGLMNFNQSIIGYEKGFNCEIIQHQIVIDEIRRMKKQWRERQVISGGQLILMISQTNYAIELSSPFCHNFVDKSDTPLIHIEVRAEVIRKDNKSLKNVKAGEVAQCMKKMETAFVNNDIESKTSSSEKSTLSVVNVLSNFSSVNSVPLFQKLFRFLLILVLLSIAANVASHQVANLSWDNTQSTNNPIWEIFNILKMKMQLSRVLNQKLELNLTQTYHVNLTKLNSYYGVSNYPQEINQSIVSLRNTYQSNLLDCFDNRASLYQDYLYSLQDTNISVVNSYSTSSFSQQQDIPVLNILISMPFDFQRLVNSARIEQTFFNTAYTSSTRSILEFSQSLDIVSSDIQKSQLISIAVHVSLIIAIGCNAFIILCVYSQRHGHSKQIYDLISSIEGRFIQKELEKLQFISTIVKNSNASEKRLKQNLLHYEMNKISSTSNGLTPHSNEMIGGLEMLSEKNYLFHGKPDTVIQKEENLAEKAQYKKKRKTSLLISATESIPSAQDDFIKNMTVSIDKFLRFVGIDSTQKDEIRKRAGELDSSVPKQKGAELCLKCGIFMVLFSGAFFLIANLLLFIQFSDDVAKISPQVKNFMSARINQTHSLLNTNKWLSPGSKSSYDKRTFDFISNGSFVESTTTPTKLLSNCLNSLKVQLYCRNMYSQMVLESQLHLAIQQVYEHGKTMSKAQLKTDKAKLIELLVYAETISEKLESLTINQIKLLCQSMYSMSSSFGQSSLWSLIVSLVWILTIFWIGNLYISSMKEQFTQEVTLISFLNHEMIFKNKRVQSFLEKIKKNNA